MLKKLQNELKGLSYCNVQFVTQSMNIEFTFQVTDTTPLGKNAVTRTKRLFHVHINQLHEDIDCQCSMFTFKEIVCRHMIAAMNFYQMNKILEKYILQWWRKYIKRRYTLIQCSFDDSMEMQRYDELTKYTKEINELASSSVENFNWWKNYPKKVKKNDGEVEWVREISRSVMAGKWSGLGRSAVVARGTRLFSTVPPHEIGKEGKPTDLFSIVNQALHIALDTDPRYVRKSGTFDRWVIWVVVVWYYLDFWFLRLLFFYILEIFWS